MGDDVDCYCRFGYCRYCRSCRRRFLYMLCDCRCSWEKRYKVFSDFHSRPPSLLRYNFRTHIHSQSAYNLPLPLQFPNFNQPQPHSNHFKSIHPTFKMVQPIKLYTVTAVSHHPLTSTQKPTWLIMNTGPKPMEGSHLP